jgi:hypothetical protein
MSDHGAAPDPIDEAYVQAEARLSDEAARAARRERVLAALAREPATPAVAPAPAWRGPAWRRGGWLAAACVAGLSLFVASQVYEPLPRQPQTAARAPAAVVAVAPTPSVPTPAISNAPAPRPAIRGVAAAPEPPVRTEARTAPADAAKAETAAPQGPLPDMAPAAPPPPPPLAIAPVRRAFPAEPPAASSVGEIVVTGGRAEKATAANDVASGDARDETVTVTASRRSSAFAAPPAAALGRFAASPARPADQAARLRAAATAGRTAEVESLLHQGAPADAPDANGDTALIKSVQADHPAAAAALRRHGASLDHRNNAGESARDIAAAKGDAALDQAIGLGP